MPKGKPLKKQQRIELSRVDHGKLMAQALIEGMIENPDSIIKQRGHGRLDIYKDLLRDDQVISTFQQRRTATVQSPWEVTPASDNPQDVQAADFIRWNLNQIPFDQITNKMLYGIHYGYSIGELIWDYHATEQKIYLKNIKVRDRNRFRFDKDGGLVLLEGLKKIPMPAEKFWIFSVGADHDDNPYGEGLAHALYWPVFFKRNGIKFWLIMLEKFGMPTATAKLSQAQIRDPQQRALALNVLDAIQVDSGVVIPEDFVVELIEASRSGTADYSSLKDAMNAAIAKIVLSQTMTTDNGASRSQAEVHAGVKDDVIKSDADLLCYSFNQQIVSQLTAFNFPKANPPGVWRRTEPEQDLHQLAERDNKILKLGYEPTEEYIKETYGDGWVKRKPEPMPPKFAPDNPIPEMGADFAEVTKLTQQRIQHRQDQQALVEAAKYLSSQYRELYGDRVNQLLNYLEDSKDIETFSEHLHEMMAEPASEQSVRIIQNATWFSRLMGIAKGDNV